MSDHQDWKPVIIRGKVSNTVKNAVVHTEVAEKRRGDSKPKDIDAPLEKVAPKLRNAFIQARTTAGKSQAQLAKELRGVKDPIASIRDLETGKLSHKDAVQLIRASERILKVKIL